MNKPVSAYMDRDGQDWELRDDDSSVRIVPFIILDPDAPAPAVGTAEQAIVVYAPEDMDALEVVAYSKKSPRIKLSERLRESGTDS